MLILLVAFASVLAPAWGHILQEHSLTPPPNGTIWAVLVAGSNGWGNYRHQADVCHAYQILHAHGIPDDHIIVMMMDDIANNTMNPTPGTIINRPNGTDVYHGVPKDYIGAAVTPENFLQIITGNATGLGKVGSGKVLKSGPNDHVFINLVDHGAPGIFGFPFQPYHPGHHPTLNVLKAMDFIDAIKTMNKTKMYKEMVIYLESCESGSMFEKILPRDLNVYAVSAASATEPSWACYYDKSRRTLLGDVFSIKWMEDTDREDVKTETIHQQFMTVKKEVTTSHVHQWGTKNISKEFLSAFMGNKSVMLGEIWGPFPPEHDPCLKTAVVSRDVPLAIVMGNVEEAGLANDMEEYKYWVRELQHLERNRYWMNAKVMTIIDKIMNDNPVPYTPFNTKKIEPMEITDWDCYYGNLQILNDECFNIALNPYAFQFGQHLVNLCETGYTSEMFAAAALEVCIHPPIYGVE